MGWYIELALMELERYPQVCDIWRRLSSQSVSHSNLYWSGKSSLPIVFAMPLHTTYNGSTLCKKGFVSNEINDNFALIH